MRIHRIQPCTRAEGPGARFAIWVQGCSRHCTGCFNPNTWDPLGGSAYQVEELWELIKRTKGIEGITFLGGEPFEQAEELARLAEKARQTELSVVTFTGYTYAELKENPCTAAASLLRHTDLLIDGPYREALHDVSRPWVGSSNQHYLFLSDRYSQRDIDGASNRLEIRIDSAGNLLVNGMAEEACLNRLFLPGAEGQ